MKDTFCAYYTNSDDITSYMVNKLNVEDSDIILEPAAGEGVFIDKILQKNKRIQIDALDINLQAIQILETKYNNLPSVSVSSSNTLFDHNAVEYPNTQIKIKQTDTLFDDEIDFFSMTGGYYSKIIGNPPYGAWQDYDKRTQLKKKYPEQYVKETYSLFLLRSLSVLKESGRLTFIIPDTFLFLNMHTQLREILLTNSKIEEILIFPSKFFPGVSFGYSNLSIITLEKASRAACLNNTVKIISGFKSSKEFSSLSCNKKTTSDLTVITLTQKEILEADQHRFILADKKTKKLLKTANVKHLGDVADVVTGFYTGDNIKFIRALNNNIKCAKKYLPIDETLLYNCSSIDGIKGVSEGYIPYIKTIPARYSFNTEWFVRWDEETIKFYLSNKKSRFQNSSFYFKQGIAIPMVKSTSIKAALINNRVFDQAIVGIFPKEQDRLLYILALMNSPTINELIHIINPTANNSANYVKQLPYIEPTKETIDNISHLVNQIIKNMHSNNLQPIESIQAEINLKIKEIYNDIS